MSTIGDMHHPDCVEELYLVLLILHHKTHDEVAALNSRFGGHNTSSISSMLIVVNSGYKLASVSDVAPKHIKSEMLARPEYVYANLTGS